MQAFTDLIDTFSQLLGPKGCPWDLKQTMRSIRPDLLEECHELLEAIALDDDEGMCEELGDLFSVIVFLGKLAEKEGRFHLEEAVAGTNEKLIRRHPHVFGETKITSDDELWKQWDRIKKTEKGKEERTSILDGIPTELPALARSQKMQKKAFQADLVVRSDVQTDPELQLGEELWAIVEKAREMGVDAEQALRRLAAHKEHEIRTCESQRSAV